MATKYRYCVTLITNKPGQALSIGWTVGMVKTSTSRFTEFVVAENADEAIKIATETCLARMTREFGQDDRRPGPREWKVLKADAMRGLFIEVTCRTAKDKRKRDTVTVFAWEGDLKSWESKGRTARELARLAQARSFKTGRVLSREGYIKHEVSSVQA